MGHVADEITPFLKARRAALDPAAVGLPRGLTRRRVRGLRREEVAQLAGISVDYYTRIEQGRAHAISDQVLNAVAQALHMTPPERAYLRSITQQRPRTDTVACTSTENPRPRVRPQIRELLDALGGSVPAIVYGPGGDVLAWNSAAARLSFDFDALPETELNAPHLIFNHPDAKTLYPDWDEVAAGCVADLRAEVGRSPGESRVHQIVCALKANEEFRRRWEEREVRERDHGTKRVLNPYVGELVLTYESFPITDAAGQRLCIYSAPKGSVTEVRLQALMARETATV